MNDKTTIFLEYKALLFSMAYNMIGEVNEAEDLVQDTYLKWMEMETTPIRYTKAYLVKMITNKCINYLNSAKVRREEYVGIWLPEPLPNQGSELADMRMDSYYSLSIGFLLLLEKLSPYERGIFLLREVFAYDYFELAEIFDKSEDNCRQIFKRAKDSLGKNVRRFPVDTQVHERILKNFLKAVAEGNMNDLIEMLKEDTVFYADGGGTVLQLNGQRLTAISKPLQGRENISRFLTTIGKKVFQFVPAFSQQVMIINGMASNVSFSDNKPLSILSIELDGEKIASLFIQANPTKLKSLEREGLANSSKN